MKVVCPNCNAPSEVDAALIPEKGAWGRCPKCRARIRLTKGGAESARGRTIIKDPEQDPEIVPAHVIPEKEKIGRSGCLLVALVVVLIAAFVLYWGIKEAVRPPVDLRPARTEPLPPPPEPEYDARTYELDLDHLRRNIRRRNYTPYAEFTQKESRLLAEMVNRCGGDCPFVIKGMIWPLEDRNGFEAEVWCGGRTIRMHYLWTIDALTVNGRPCPPAPRPPDEVE